MQESKYLSKTGNQSMINGFLIDRLPVFDKYYTTVAYAILLYLILAYYAQDATTSTCAVIVIRSNEVRFDIFSMLHTKRSILDSGACWWSDRSNN